MAFPSLFAKAMLSSTVLHRRLKFVLNRGTDPCLGFIYLQFKLAGLQPIQDLASFIYEDLKFI